MLKKHREQEINFRSVRSRRSVLVESLTDHSPALLTAAVHMMMTPCHVTQAEAAAELAPLYTPPAGGTVYVLGAGIVAVTNKFFPDAHLVHEATTGAMDMVRRTMRREGTNNHLWGKSLDHGEGG